MSERTATASVRTGLNMLLYDSSIIPSFNGMFSAYPMPLPLPPPSRRPSLGRTAELVKGERHDPVGDPEGLLDTITVVAVDVDVEGAGDEIGRAHV